MKERTHDKTNIYLTYLEEEAIVDFVKDHQEHYDKTHKKFEDKARKDFLWERFGSSRKLSVKVCKTWFKSQRANYGKLYQSKFDKASKQITEKQN